MLDVNFQVITLQIKIECHKLEMHRFIRCALKMLPFPWEYHVMCRWSTLLFQDDKSTNVTLVSAALGLGTGSLCSCLGTVRLT